jgi:PAS domain S-box-containing protein
VRSCVQSGKGSGLNNAGKILIVDDTEQARKLLLNILVAEEYDVVAADSGELALAAVALSPPELILLDLKMPVMGGAEVCRRLKSKPESRHIPVLLLSASLDFEERMDGLQSGAVDFINKPFRSEELLARVRTHLELARLRTNLEGLVAQRNAELQAVNEKLRSELEVRKRFQERLVESEQRFRSIADTVPAGIFLMDRDGHCTYVNKWLLTFLGSTTEQLTGFGWRPYIHPQDLDRVAEELVTATREHGFCQSEARILRTDGEYRWIAATVAPRIVNGEFVGHIGVDLDVTDMKLVQERVVASQKLESLGMLAAGIAHNFNTLLSTILAHAELAIDEIPDETPAHESISTIAAVALRAAEIVNLLVAYADNSAPDGLKPVDLSSVIQKMLPLLQGSVSGDTSLAVNLADGLPAVKAEAAQIQQVILNLVLNASEAMHAKPGTISVSTAEIRAGQGTHKPMPLGLSEGNYVLLEVVDTGCGMSSEVKDKIFDPFFSTKFFGRGLGLASVQGIVRRSGGAINIESSPGQGSRFEVWLPCWDARCD